MCDNFGSSLFPPSLNLPIPALSQKYMTEKPIDEPLISLILTPNFLVKVHSYKVSSCMHVKFGNLGTEPEGLLG